MVCVLVYIRFGFGCITVFCWGALCGSRRVLFSVSPELFFAPYFGVILLCGIWCFVYALCMFCVFFKSYVVSPCAALHV